MVIMNVMVMTLGTQEKLQPQTAPLPLPLPLPGTETETETETETDPSFVNHHAGAGGPAAAGFLGLG